MRKSIYVKLIASFMIVFILSNIVASFMSYYGSELNSVDFLQDQLKDTLEIVSKEVNDHQLSIDSLETVLDNNYITVSSLDNLSDFTLDESVKNDLSEGKILSLKSKEHAHEVIKNPIALMEFDGHYLMASANFDNLGFSTRSLVMEINIRALIIGSLLFIVIARWMVKPIQTLIEATKRIANNDFDVQIDEKRSDEIGQLMHSFNTMAEELSATEMLRDDFISDVSHEFKTPLTSIQGYTKLLRDAEEDNKNEYIDIVLEETEHLSQLTTSILTLNRLDSEKNEKEFKNYRVDEQIRKVLVMLEHKWSAKNIKFNLDIEEVSDVGDEILMTQVWFNLIDNAIKFSDHDSQIDISLKESPHFEFRLKDYGIGLSEKDKNRIFTKFYKADRSRSKDGNGLGLSIVKRILEIHDKEIEVISEEGIGTEIIIK